MTAAALAALMVTVNSALWPSFSVDAPVRAMETVAGSLARMVTVMLLGVPAVMEVSAPPPEASLKAPVSMRVMVSSGSDTVSSAIWKVWETATSAETVARYWLRVQASTLEEEGLAVP